MRKRMSSIAFVLVLGSVLTSALVAVDHYTAPLIERNRVLKVKMRVLEALDIPHTRDDVEEEFSEKVEVIEVEGKNFYISPQGNIAFEITGSGLWGPISGVLALFPDLETIKGITIIHHEETPGLGGRIADKDYLDRFRDKKIVPELKILAPGKAKSENEVDGITGATLSSSALERIINGQSRKFISLFEEAR